MTEIPPEPQPKSIMEFLYRDPIEAAAVATFVVSVISLLFVGLIAAIGAIFAPQSVDMPLLMRVTEVSLRLIAVAILVAFVSRKVSNTLVVTFSIIVIAALIVPSKDIVRFMLIASNSERNYDDFFSRSEVSGLNLSPFNKGGDAQTRFSETSHQLAFEIERVLGLEFNVPEVRDPDLQERLRQTIENGLENYIVQLATVEVVANGAANALLAVSEGAEGFPRWISLYGDNNSAVRNLGFLKSKGLVSFPVDDFREAQVTAFGQKVANQLIGVSGRDQVDRVAPGTFDTLQQEGVPRNLISLGEQSVEELLAAERDLVLDYDIQQLTLTSETNQVLNIRLTAGTDADPYLILYDADGVEVSANDDGGGGLNAVLTVPFAAGQPWTIGMRAYGGADGAATLSATLAE